MQLLHSALAIGTHMTSPTERLWRDVDALDNVRPARWYTLKRTLGSLETWSGAGELTALHSSALQ